LPLKGKEMTKAELVGKIAGESGMMKTQVQRTLATIISVVSSALSVGDKVRFTGFGTFSVGLRSERLGRNPRTGGKVAIPASKVIKFKADKSLVEKLK